MARRTRRLNRNDRPVSGTGLSGVGLEHGDALLQFSGASGGTNDVALAAARAALVEETSSAAAEREIARSAIG
jgi:hypothetical protein